MKVASFILQILTVFVLFLYTGCNQQSGKQLTDDYGPRARIYELPAGPGKIYYVAPDGNASSDGLAADRPTTIEEAIARVVTGDAIIMRGGVYRTGDLVFNQGITIQPYLDEKPVLKGTMVAQNWSKISDTLWVTDWDRLFPAGPESWWNRRRNEQFTPMHRFNNDAVFIDGQYLQSAGSIEEVNKGTFYVDYSKKKIYIGADPAGRLVEITAYRKALYRTLGTANGRDPDKKGPVIRGLEITQYPDTMVHIGTTVLAVDQHGKDIAGTLLEDCTFSNCFRIGVFCNSDNMIMRHCRVFNTNTEGIYVVASADILIEKNIIEQNNIEKWTGFYPAAVKIFNQSHRAIFRENLVTNQPNSNGVWWDVGNHDAVFVRNVVSNVSQNGLFFEISDGALIAGNLFVDCNQSIYVLNSANVEVYNNTMINSRITFSRDNRGDQLGVFGWHDTTGPGVEERHGHVLVNNLMYMSGENNSPMLQTQQSAALCERLNKPHLKKMNNNVFVRAKTMNGGDETRVPIIRWTPYPDEDCRIDIFSPAELHEIIPEFSSKDKYFGNYEGPLFADKENKNYRLVKEFKGIKAAVKMPARVAELTGLKTAGKPFPGAFAP